MIIYIEGDWSEPLEKADFIEIRFLNRLSDLETREGNDSSRNEKIRRLCRKT